MAERLTGEGILELAQVVNLARAFLAGPEDFAIRTIKGRVIQSTLGAVNLGALESIQPLAAVGATAAKLGIGGAALGPIAGAIGLITSLFQSKPKILLANLPPEDVIWMLHKSEAIHLFARGVGAVQAQFNKFNALQAQVGCVSRTALLTSPVGIVAQDLANMGVTLPGGWSGSDRANVILAAVSNEWAPPSGGMNRYYPVTPNDPKIITLTKDLTGVFIGNVNSPGRTLCAAKYAALFQNLSYYELLRAGFAPTTAPVTNLINDPVCQSDRLLGFGAAYACAWASSWIDYFKNVPITAYAGELGEWIRDGVRAQPRYKGMIDRMVMIEEERARIRRSFATSFVEVMRNPTPVTVKAFQDKMTFPALPALLEKADVRPATDEEFQTSMSIEQSRATAQTAVGLAAVALERAKIERPDLVEQITSLLGMARSHQDQVTSTLSAEVASQEAAKAGAAAKEAVSLVTPLSEKVTGLLKRPEILIPGLLGLGLFWALRGEGR